MQISEHLRRAFAATPPAALPTAHVTATDRYGGDVELDARTQARLHMQQERLRESAGPSPDETARIVRLPRVTYEGADWTERLRLPSGKQVLRAVQSEMLEAIVECQGGVGLVGTGWGKSLMALLASEALGDVELALIFTPASTVQTLTSTYYEARRHWRIRATTLIYSTHALSQPRPDQPDLLDQITEGVDPARILLVVDEAHDLGDRTSARTRRVERYIDANPQVRCVFLSGSLTSRSVLDFAHLACWALRGQSPLPRDGEHLAAWSQCLDQRGRPTPADWLIFRPLWSAFATVPLGSVVGRERQRIARDAFRERLRSCPGIVATEETSLAVRLEIIGRDLAVPPEVTEVLRQMQDSGVDPSGEVIPDDVTRWRMERYISSGFYYQWVWGHEGPDAAWLGARHDWHRMVRNEIITRADTGYDSPFLVYNACDVTARERTTGPARELLEQILDDTPRTRSGVEQFEQEHRDVLAQLERQITAPGHSALMRAWLRWVVHHRKPPPDTVPVWISKYLVEDALRWASAQDRPVILWYDTNAVGEALRAAGLPVFGGGVEMPAQAITCGASIAAHGVGKNLQPWNRQLVLSPPSGGKTWEQMLARTHRPGQQADVVQTFTYQHTDAYVQALASAIDGARYVETATGNKQKLLHAVYSGCRVPLDVLTGGKR